MRRGVSRLEVVLVSLALIIALALALPAVLRSRDAARKAQGADNFRRIGVALTQERILHPPLLPRSSAPSPPAASATLPVPAPATSRSEEAPPDNDPVLPADASQASADEPPRPAGPR